MPSLRVFQRIFTIVLILGLIAGCAPQETQEVDPVAIAETAAAKAAATAAAGVVAGLPTAEEVEAPEVEPEARDVIWVEFFHPWGGSFGEFIDELVEQFNTNQSDVKVIPTQVGSTYEEILAKVQARIAAGDPPDVSIQGFLYTDYVAENIPYHSLDSFIEDPEFEKDDVAASFLGLGQYGGEQVALPFSVSTPVLFYNADLFRDAGLDPEDPPETWDEVMEYAEALTKDTDNDGEIDQYGIYFRRHAWYFQVLCQAAGGVLMRDGEITFNEEACVNALQFMVDLQEAGYAPNLTSSQAQASFTSGTIGMFVSTSAFAKSILDAAAFEVRAAEHPYLTHQSVAAGGANVWMFSEDPIQAEGAWRFIKWLTSKEGTTIISKGTGYMPIRYSVLTDPAYMGTFLEEYPIYLVALDQVDYMTPWQNFPGGPQIPGLVLSAWEDALAGTPPQEALDNAADEANAILAQE